MNALRLLWVSLNSQKLSCAIAVLLLALGVAMVVVALLLQE